MDIVSACMVGCKCRYDGGHKKRDDPRFVGCVPVCPEMFSGLGVPRPPAEIKGDLIVTKNNRDVTDNFERGARIAADFASSCDAKRAFLKENSHSCGVTKVYDGSFTGSIVPGEGVFTRMLREKGIEVVGVE